MTNITGAKDAAATIALRDLNVQERPVAAPPVKQVPASGKRPHDRLRGVVAAPGHSAIPDADGGDQGPACRRSSDATAAGRDSIVQAANTFGNFATVDPDEHGGLDRQKGGRPSI